MITARAEQIFRRCGTSATHADAVRQDETIGGINRRSVEHERIHAGHWHNTPCGSKQIAHAKDTSHAADKGFAPCFYRVRDYWAEAIDGQGEDDAVLIPDVLHELHGSRSCGQAGVASLGQFLRRPSASDVETADHLIASYRL